MLILYINCKFIDKLNYKVYIQYVSLYVRLDVLVKGIISEEFTQTIYIF